MSIVTATLRGSGRTNQDTVVVTDHAVAVLDGATAWLPQESGRDGGWYSRQLGAALAGGLDTDVSLVGLLQDAIWNLSQEFDLTPGNAPESTATIARWSAEEVEILVLGDSPAVIYLKDAEPLVLLDDRLQATGAEARKAYKEHLGAGHGYGPELDALLAQLQRDEMVWQNRSGGYWAASASPEAPLHALTARYPLSDVESILLLTDGASAAVDDYEHPSTWDAVDGVLRENGPDSLLASIHHLEESDAAGLRWPRAKPHDDKTLARIRSLKGHAG